MYVRKFEAETLEDALKSIKQELGPDAIILKTITNKGLKGAFKKNRIEITAAISEKNYTKKAKVDSVLTPGQKDEFYAGRSSYVSNMIDSHSKNDDKIQAAKSGYGNAGLNKPVSSIKNTENSVKSGLDAFLNTAVEKVTSKVSPGKVSSVDQFLNEPITDHLVGSQAYVEPVAQREVKITRVDDPSLYEEAASYEENSSVSNEQLTSQRNKIDDLEKKLFELTRSFEKMDKREAAGIYELSTTLRSLDINEQFIKKVVKKAIFELSDDDLENAEIVYEFALREMVETIQAEMPLFSSVDAQTPVITVLISETSTGQTSMMQKVGALKNDSVLIKNVGNNQADARKFSEEIFDMNVVRTNGIAEIVSECRKAVEQGKSVFIDYKNADDELNEIKKFIDGLKRSFDKVEVLISLSAIHSELYNRKVVSRYHGLSNGLVVSNLDLCLNFGALFNIAEEFQTLPFKFYGTGEVVPDDLEAATGERILAGIFQLS